MTRTARATLWPESARAVRGAVARWVRSAIPVLAVTLLLLILLPLGTQSTAGSAAALAAVLFLTMLVSAGMEHSAVILLAVGFLMSPLNDVRPIASLTFMTASDVFLVLGIGLLIPGLVGRKFRPPTAFVVGALGVVAMGLVSSAVNPSAAMSLNSMLRLVVGALTLPVVFMLWRPRREIVVILAAAYVGGNVVNVVAARINGQASDENRYIGLSTHPNILGFCAMLGLALIPFLLQELPRRFSWIVLLAGAICGYGIWISGSRAALLVAGAVMVLYPLLARSIGAALMLFGLGIVPVFLVGRTLSSGEVGNNIIGRLAGGGSATASDQVREALAATTLERFLAHPLFGVGFGEVLEAHNIYLQVAAAGGVAVLLFYIVLLLSVLRQPFAIGSSYRLLALPAMAYALIGPITPLLWDRYIWCALAIPFLVAASGKQEPAESSPHNVMTKENA